MTLTYEQASKIKALTDMALAEAGVEGTAGLIDIGAGWYSVSVPRALGNPGIRAAAMAGIHVLGGSTPMRCSFHANTDTWNEADRGPRGCTTSAQMMADPTYDCRLAPSALEAIGSLGVPTGAGAGIGRKR